MIEREGKHEGEDMQTQVARRFLSKQAERRAREILFRSFNFYSHTHLLFFFFFITLGLELSDTQVYEP